MLMRDNLARQLADVLEDGGWPAKARPNQLAPAGDWNGWLCLAGRGWGKTRTGAEWLKDEVERGVAKRIALVGPTSSDCRDVMVEGESGILSISSDWCRPDYEPSKRKLTWPNGAVAHTFSADEPDRLRGPQFDRAWCDEIAAWPYLTDCWAMLMLGLRLGKHPRWVATSTPRPIKLLKELLTRKDVAVSRGSTYENEANLPDPFLKAIRDRYEGTRLGRQELNAELLEDVADALWSRAMLDSATIKAAPELRRVVVGVDPSGTKGASDSGDSIGIVVAGIDVNGVGYVLADRSCKLSPDGWGRRAVEAYREFKADRIVAEKNFGGAMVEHVIRTVDRSVAYKEVTASRGKAARAEPIAALYEQSRIKHVGLHAALEDEMCSMTANGYAGDGSPDRLDAAVWALTELMVTPQAPVASFGTWAWK